jgi:DNA invertase Pin-like site-specific DNA recombinase
MASKSHLIGKATCALYHRVSTRDQNQKLARRELRQAAAARGLRITMDVEETGSGALNNRPGLRRVMDAARKGDVGAVLVWKLDRFGRSSLDVLSNIQALTDAGVRFVAVTQGLDVKPQGDAMSHLILTVLAAVAEFERSLIAERTSLAVRAARRAGRAWGRRPAPGPTTAQVRGLRASGTSWSDVATQLECTVAMARRRAA